MLYFRIFNISWCFCPFAGTRVAIKAGRDDDAYGAKKKPSKTCDAKEYNRRTKHPSRQLTEFLAIWFRFAHWCQLRLIYLLPSSRGPLCFLTLTPALCTAVFPVIMCQRYLLTALRRPFRRVSHRCCSAKSKWFWCQCKLTSDRPVTSKLTTFSALLNHMQFWWDHRVSLLYLNCAINECQIKELLLYSSHVGSAKLLYLSMYRQPQAF